MTAAFAWEERCGLAARGALGLERVNDGAVPRSETILRECPPNILT
jgi:hypothetical protein